MKSQIILNETSGSRFVTRKRNIVNDQSNSNLDIGNETVCNTEVLKSNLCDYNDAYILVRGDTTIVGRNVTEIAFENCAPLIKSITKVDWTTIVENEDLDLVMLMYNLIE